MDEVVRRDAERLARIPFDHPGGPEATPEEIAEWARGEPFLVEEARAMVDDPMHTSVLSSFATRRSLEAMLAAHEGMDPEAYKRAHAHERWGELYERARRTGTEVIGDPDEPGFEQSAWHDAVNLERYYRQHLNAQAGNDTGVLLLAEGADLGAIIGTLEEGGAVDAMSPALQTLRDTRGPGARSGRIEDYTRTELRTVCGYTSAEAEGLSDDDLRAMALDGHLAPRWRGSPSHADLAAAYAARWTGVTRRKLEFRKAMRMPYGDLVGSEAMERLGHHDDGRKGPRDLWDEVAEVHPMLTTPGACDTSIVHRLARANGIATTRPERERQRVGSDMRYATPLQAEYEDAFQGFAESYGGRVHLRHIRRGRRSARTLAFHVRENGDIHVQPHLISILDRARASTAERAEVAHAVGVLAHEIGHGIEARDAGTEQYHSRLTDTPEHTVGEGYVEAVFGRLGAQALAERMGLWDSRANGALRGQAREAGAYDREVETIVALTAARHGEFDADVAADGGYRQPEALSERARQALVDDVVHHGVHARIERLAEIPGGRDPDGTPTPIREVLSMCKTDAYGGWRLVAMPDSDGRRVRRWVPGEPFSEALADRITDLLTR